MRRGIEFRVAFAPTRVSEMHLRAAYALVSPVIERAIVAVVQRDVADERSDAEQATRRLKIGGNE